MSDEKAKATKLVITKARRAYRTKGGSTLAERTVRSAQARAATLRPNANLRNVILGSAKLSSIEGRKRAGSTSAVVRRSAARNRSGSGASDRCTACLLHERPVKAAHRLRRARACRTPCRKRSLR